MSRILKRPMFKTGGSTNEGIMTGLVNRKGYTNGSKAEEYADEYYSMLSKYKPPAPKLPLGQIGLNLVSGEYAGDGFLSNVARSAKGPYEQWTQADDATRNLDYQTRMAAAKMGISKKDALDLARAKAAGSGMQKDYSDQRTRDDFTKMFLEQKAALPWTQNPSVQQAYPEASAEYYVDIKRNLIRSGSDIKPAGFVPYDEETGEFNYEDMIPGMYYYDPRLRGKLVIRIPEDADTPENETGYFELDLKTGQQKKLEKK